MWELENWCCQTVVLQKTVESPLDCKEIKPLNPKGSQPDMFIGRTDVEAEASILGHLMRRADSLEKTLTLEKTLMLGKPEGRRRRGQQRWDGWMASPTQWTWVWVSSGSWWWTGKSGMLQSMGSQRDGYYWVTELNCVFKNKSDKTWASQVALMVRKPPANAGDIWDVG